MARARRLRLLLLFLAAASPAPLRAERPSPPEPLARLLEAGQVEFDFYDPRDTPMRYPGKASFQIDLQRTFSFRYTTRDDDEARTLTIRPKLRTVTVQLRHTVLLPDRYEARLDWNDRLLRHEMDHIAISCDPRLALLAEELVRSMRPFKRTIERGRKPTNEEISTYVNEAIDERAKAVGELVRAYYRKLDAVSDHGRRPIPDRKVFFENLYTKRSLDDEAFPHTGELLDLLRSPEYRDAELPHAAGD